MPISELQSVNLKVPQVWPGGQAFDPALLDALDKIGDTINQIITTINQIIGTQNGCIGAGFDGKGSVVEAGAAVEVVLPYPGTITGAIVISNIAGSIEFEIEKCTYSAFDTMSSIVASAPPTLSSAYKSSDTTLSGWTTSVSAGDIFRFSIVSASVLTRVIVVLLVTKGTT